MVPTLPRRTACWRPLVLAAALSLVPALAAPAAGEVVLDLYGGRSWTRDADLRVNRPGAGDDFRLAAVPFDDESFDDPPYYGLRAGYFLPGRPWLGAALDFVHFKAFARTSVTTRLSGTRAGSPVDEPTRVDAVVQEFSISHGVNYLTVGPVARARLARDAGRFPHGRVQVYGGLAVGPVIAHPENRVEGRPNRERYEVAGAGVQGFLGVRVLATRRVSLFVEYKATAADLEVDVAGGSARVDERTHHLAAGISIAAGR